MTSSNIDQQVIIYISGQDEIGILSSFTKIFEELNIYIINIQQITSLGQLHLALHLSVLDSIGFQLLKRLHVLSSKLKLSLSYDFLEHNKNYFNNRDIKQHFGYYTLTLLAPSLSSKAFNSVTQVLASLSVNIIRIYKTSFIPLNCVKLLLETNKKVSIKSLKQNLFDFATKCQFDMSIEDDTIYRTPKRLVIIDMDSTLIQQEVIDELADQCNVKSRVEKITEKAMNGEIDFKSALLQRVQLLKGIHVLHLGKVLSRIKLTVGAEKLIRILKQNGVKVALVSGGFDFFTKYFQEKLDLDYQFANTLEIKDSILTGNLVGNIIDRKKKATILRELASENQIPLSQTVAVGDGANDLDMLNVAGLGIAFNATPKVKEEAKAFITVPSLDSILHLLGIPI